MRKIWSWKNCHAASVSRFTLLISLSFVLCSCNAGDSTAPPINCGIRMQAQVSLSNALGISQTHNLGGVRTSGTMLSTVGASACLGTLTSFGGITDYASGLNDNSGMRMNSNWQVAWDYSSTSFSSCLVFTNQGFVPDAGAIFNNVCNL
jgi:hypothetical protein